MINYGFSKELHLPFEQVISRVTDELRKEGFGILTKIDVQEKFKEKLDIVFQRYMILGASNPPSAHKAIVAEENIGLMLPCNVIVFEKDGKVVLSLIKPSVAMSMIENDKLEKIASSIEKKLEKVFASIKE